jgi:predicted DNA-binding ribbon-helix-helix protein
MVKRKIEGQGVTVCAYMEESLYEILRKMAFVNRTSVSSLVREIIKKHITSSS